ncbi:MAG: hypothetical protein WCR42_15635 [bacterium]
MKIKVLVLISFLFIMLACTKKDELIVKDFKDNEFNLLESKKEKIIIITNNLICHSCIIDLDNYLANNYNLRKYDYILLTKDLKDTPSRRLTFETYKNEYTPDIHKVFFTKEDPKVKKKLHIPKKIFAQSTPYIIYIGKNKKPHYFSRHEIFDADGFVKESFSIK